jgi:hypothetical protein
MRRRWYPTAAAKQAEADRQRRYYEFLNSPMAIWDKVFGGALGRELSQPYVPKELNMDTPIERLRAAMLQHAHDGEPLMQAVRRWKPDPAHPGKSLDGSDLDAHPVEHRTRKLKEAEAALKGHREATAPRVLNPLVAAAQKEPGERFKVGTKLSSDARAEVPLLVEQYRGLTKQQQAELGKLGVEALERGDLQMALAHKRAADVLNLQSPELDAALANGDLERVAGKAELEKVGRWIEAHQIDEMRRYARAGIASSVEQVEESTWAQQNGYSEVSGSYVEAVLSGE